MKRADILILSVVMAIALTSMIFAIENEKAKLVDPKGLSGDQKSSTVKIMVDESDSLQHQPSMTQPRTGEQIKWSVISNGGTINATSPNFKLSCTIGQIASDSGSSPNYKLFHGFWQVFMTGGGNGCCNLPGDANNDTQVNVGDAVYIINYVFKGGPPPICGDEGDANFDCSINVGDAVYLINYVFKSGPAPECGCVGW